MPAAVRRVESEVVRDWKRCVFAFVLLWVVTPGGWRTASAEPVPAPATPSPSCPESLQLAPPTGSVTDLADVLRHDEEAVLKREIDEMKRAGLAEMLIYLAPALPQGTTTLEDVTLCAANEWGVGDAGRDDGIIIFAFMDDRKIRIELGHGSAHAISNETASRIISENMAPLFRQGAYGEGLRSAVNELRRLLAAASP